MSLAGHGVLVTRPRERARGLAAKIEAAGGRAVVFPVIEIEPLPQPEAGERHDIVVFTSPMAVVHGLRWAGAAPRALAVGPGTAAELRAKGVKNVVHPAKGADSESVLALPELSAVAGKRVLIVRGKAGRALLGATLARRGARVAYVECYRRVRPLADPAPVLAAWAAGEIAAVTVNSGEALVNLLALLGEQGARRVRETPLFVPHPRVAEQAAQGGAREVLVAGPRDDEMIERLVAYFSDERRTLRR